MAANPNDSGSFHFPGMNDLSYTASSNLTLGEFRWHAAIDAKWPTTSEVEQNTIRAFCAKWGPKAGPASPDPGTKDFVRARYWRRGNSVPKCHSCWSGAKSRPPGIAQIPIGLQPGPPLMPCGCIEQEAMFEQWAVGVGAFEQVRPLEKGAAAGRISAMGVEGRRLYMSMWANAIGITSQEISWAHLAFAHHRLPSVMAIVAAEDNAGVHAWPRGT